MKNATLILVLATILGVALLLFPLRGSAMNTAEVPRGIRNNNPGNIRAFGIAWQGQTGSDGEYAIFSAPVWGIRAMALNLKTYFSRYNLNTIRTIINRWAPPTENLTDKYASSVSQRTGLGLDEKLDYNRDVSALIDAIIYHENGVQPYSSSLISDAIARARL